MKKKDIELIFKGADDESFQELLDDLRPKGEWIWLGDNPSPNHKWSCSKCGRGVKEQENFCPRCGTDMRKGSSEHNDCKECLNSRLVISENGYKPICTLSATESNNCLLNDKCKFEGNPLYLMAKGGAK